MYVLAALAAGIGIGLARGGRVRNIAEADLHWLPLLFAGVVVQVVGVGIAAGTTGVVMLVASYVVIAAFAAGNLHVAGMGVVAVGVAMNALVIGANDGMPVRREAIVAAGIAEWSDVDELEIGGKRHLERDDDRLMVLADIIPVPLGPMAQVLSFGDLVMVVGVADVIVHLMRRPRAAATAPGFSRPEQEGSASPGSD